MPAAEDPTRPAERPMPAAEGRTRLAEGPMRIPRESLGIPGSARAPHAVCACLPAGRSGKYFHFLSDAMTKTPTSPALASEGSEWASNRLGPRPSVRNRTGTTMAAESITSRIALATTIAAGVQKNLAGQATVLLDGVPTKPDAIIAICTALMVAAKAVASLKAAWIAAVSTQKAAIAAFDAMEASLHRYVVSASGPSSPLLVDYGWKPKTATDRPVIVKAVAAERGVSTRKARGTGGKRQKALVKGQPVTLVVSGTPTKPPTT